MLEPDPDNTPDVKRRQTESRRRRELASDIAQSREPQASVANGEHDRYRSAPTSYHKGLPHDVHGIPDRKALDALVHALNRDGVSDGAHAPFDVALGPRRAAGANPGERETGYSVDSFHTVLGSGDDADAVPKVRNWESPLAGHAYDVEGPDAGDVAMAPAPTLAGDELVAEMAEVYALALLRDVPFSDWSAGTARFKRYSLVRAGKGRKVRVVKSVASIRTLVAELAKLPWYDRDTGFEPSYGALGHDRATALELRRHRARFAEGDTSLTCDNAFRGSSPGCHDGPYVSQFLLIGSPSPERPDDGGAGHAGKHGHTHDTVSSTKAKDAMAIAPCAYPVGTRIDKVDAAPGDPGVASGYIAYGVQRIDQRVNAHLTGRDYLSDWPLWLDVQNGADTRGTDEYMPDGRPRFVATPRDLATYVHFDQLYQAYLNACLLMFSYKVPFDLGFPSGSAHVTRGSFATFGGPHVLSLVTEVASRALKAVRRQKFQQHLRGRPEQLAAMLTLAANDDSGNALGDAADDVTRVLDALKDKTPKLLAWIADHNAHQNREVADSATGSAPTIYPRRASTRITDPERGETLAHPWDDHHAFTPETCANYLLPMAFPEGSPMHASYGAGHATVAGACTTVLKAFFELSSGAAKPSPARLDQPLDVDTIKADDTWWTPATMGTDGLGLAHVYEAPSTTRHDALAVCDAHDPNALTIEGELNKLAANIAIGRDMAGVHFYTDYFDSLRMGERIAVGILEEQLTGYPDPVSMRLTSFDGDRLILRGDGEGRAWLEVREPDQPDWATGDRVAVRAARWRDRHVAEFRPSGAVRHASGSAGHGAADASNV